MTNPIMTLYPRADGGWEVQTTVRFEGRGQLYGYIVFPDPEDPSCFAICDLRKGRVLGIRFHRSEDALMHCMTDLLEAGVATRPSETPESSEQEVQEVQEDRTGGGGYFANQIQDYFDNGGV